MQLNTPFTPGFFRRLQQLKIRTRRVMLGSRQGSHVTNRRGQGLEFADYRQYTAGDDFRHIDWGVYGRSDRLYIREFRAEQDLNVIVLLDASSSMAHPHNSGKFELARNLALSLGYIALCDGDSVVFGVLGKKVSPKFIGQKALPRAIAALKAVAPDDKLNIVEAVRRAIAQQRLPAKCFFISDFMFDIKDQTEALDLLRSRNFDISVVQILAPTEINLDLEQSGVFVDSETGDILEVTLDRGAQKEYAVKLAEHVEALEQYCRKAGISHILVSSEEDLPNVVLTRFPAAGVLK